jgi:hypothetical protein
LITDQPIETGTIAGESRFEQGVDSRSDQAQPGAFGCRRSRF